MLTFAVAKGLLPELKPGPKSSLPAFVHWIEFVWFDAVVLLFFTELVVRVSLLGSAAQCPMPEPVRPWSLLVHLGFVIVELMWLIARVARARREGADTQ